MPSTDHCAFILRLRRSAPGRYAVAVQFAAPAHPTDTKLLGDLGLSLEPLRAAGADPAAIGRALTEQLFTPRALDRAYTKATTLAASAGLPLRIRLDLDPDDAELHSLPWELLRDPDDADHLAFSETALLSRLQPTATPRLLRRPPHVGLRACIAVAAPSDLKEKWNLATIDADAEISNARTALGANAEVLPGPLTRTALLAGLRDGVDLLYLVCHGKLQDDGPYLALATDQGTLEWASGAELAQEIGGLQTLPLLVVLAVCESGGSKLGDTAALTALGPQLVAAGVPAVIAMQGKLSMTAAKLLFPELLTELMRDGQIDRAMAAARKAARTHLDWWRPALWMHLSDGRIWQAEPDVAAIRLQALHQLRAPTADFVGREKEIADLVAALERAADDGTAAAIWIIRGMGGVGKTELAYVVADRVRERFPDAQIVLDLGGAGATPLSAETALGQVIHAFAPEAKLPAERNQLISLYRTTLAGRRALILADDAGDAEQVRPLLPPRGSALLITSRNRFSLPGMEPLDLDDLDPDEAIRLLLTLYPRIGDAAADLAKRCGYLPLALRVSAGILSNDDTLSVPRYLERFDDERSLAALRDPDNPNLDVDATLALSYNALSPAGKAALEQLSVFKGSFDLAAAEAVLALPDGAGVDTTLSDLYRRSLVEYDTAIERYSLHDLVRALGATRLGNTDAVALRHAEYYRDTVAKIARIASRTGRGQIFGLSLFDSERREIDGAWSWSIEHEGHATADTLLFEMTEAIAGTILRVRYDLRSELIPRLQVCLTVAQRRNDSEGACRVLLNLGAASNNLGEMRLAIGYFERAQALSAHDDLRTAGIIQNNIGSALVQLGDLRQAVTYLLNAVAIQREINDWRNISTTLNNLGLTYVYLGNVSEAINHCNEALNIATQAGNDRTTALSYTNLGFAACVSGDYPRAIEHLKQAIQINTEVIDRRIEYQARSNLLLAYIEQEISDPTGLVDVGAEILDRIRDIGDRRMEALALRNLGLTYYYQSAMKKALECFDQALRIAEAIGDRRSTAQICWDIGVIVEQQGDLSRTEKLLKAWVNYTHEEGHTQADQYAAYLAALRARIAADAGSDPTAPTA